MITDTQMPQYVDCKNDSQSRPMDFPRLGFPSLLLLHLLQKLNINTMKHRYGRNKYPDGNLSHSFTIVIDEKLGNPNPNTGFPICNLGPKEHDFWGTAVSEY